MINRRQVLTGSAALLAAAQLRWTTSAHAATPLRLASVKFGSLSWLIDTVQHNELAAKNGLDLDVLTVASHQAGPIALLAGEADVIVSDWTWAMRQRSLGEKLKFAPYSSALGAIMVPEGSSIKSIADLEGKKLGVAGSAIDKSWLLLRSYSRKTVGKDMAEMVTPAFGTPPLLAEELRSGRLDACLNFWTYSARLAGDGFVPLLRMETVLQALGVDPVPPLVGYVWKESTQAKKGKAISDFLKSMEQGNEILASSDEAWDRLKPLIKPGSDAELKSIARFYKSGIPETWGEPQTKAAKSLMDVLIGVGDQTLVGNGTRFDAELFHVKV